jgi:hypothetical protein
MNLEENTKLFILNVLEENKEQKSSVFSNLETYKKYYLKEITAPGLQTPQYQGRKATNPLAGQQPPKTETGEATPTIPTASNTTGRKLTRSDFAGGAGEGVGGTPKRKTDTMGQIFGETNPLMVAGAYGAGKAADFAGDILGGLGGAASAGIDALGLGGIGGAALKRLSIGGLDIGRKALGQFSQVMGTDWIEQNIENIAAQQQSDIASAMGARGAVVPGKRKYSEVGDAYEDERSERIKQAKRDKEEAELRAQGYLP